MLGACSVTNGNGSAAASASSQPIATSASEEPPYTPPSPQVLKYFQTFTSDDAGQIELTPILDISGYRTVNLEVGAGVRKPVPA